MSETSVNQTYFKVRSRGPGFKSPTHKIFSAKRYHSISLSLNDLEGFEYSRSCLKEELRSNIADYESS